MLLALYSFSLYIVAPCIWPGHGLKASSCSSQLFSPPLLNALASGPPLTADSTGLRAAPGESLPLPWPRRGISWEESELSLSLGQGCYRL